MRRRAGADLKRPYSPRERGADAILHVVGVVGSIAAAAALLSAAAGGLRAIAASAIYGAGLVATFGASAAYNLETRPERKERWRRLDHAAIFLMIAGSYTPFALVGLSGAVAYALLAAVWLIALAGVALKLGWPRRLDRAAIALYLGLGWLGLPVFVALADVLPGGTLALLGIGGALYTAGVAFHVWERLPYQNAIWHGLVLAAAACHYVAIFGMLARG